MVVTQTDIKNDLHILMQDIEDGNRPLVSPKAALKISMALPLSCILFYAIAMVWITYSFEPYINHFDHHVGVLQEYGYVLAFGSVSIIFALFIGAALYAPALVYLTLSEEVRNRSIIIGRFKKLMIKLGRFFLLCNAGLALVSCRIPELLVGAPFLIMISFLIMQGIVSAEAARYGVRSVIGKLSKIAKKI